MNEAGAELLHFLLLNEATICNTWFQKKNIHKETWQHPKTKSWHCIDYVMMREKDRRCVDVEVRCGSRVPHGSLAPSCQAADGQAVVQEGKEDDQQTVCSVTLK